MAFATARADIGDASDGRDQPVNNRSLIALITQVAHYARSGRLDSGPW